jgi:hypothetical protein
MFQFSGFAPTHYEFMCRSVLRQGFPHSEIIGSKPIRGSPMLIAAYHVLHRLSVPRHSPNALKSLDHSHYCCSSPTQYLREGRREQCAAFIVAQILDRNALSAARKNLPKTHFHAFLLCFVSHALSEASGFFERPRGPIHTKHFIHDVKQHYRTRSPGRNLLKVAADAAS